MHLSMPRCTCGGRQMIQNPDILRRHLERASLHYVLWVSDDQRWLIFENFQVPPGFDRRETQVLVGLPMDYPITPPVYLPNGIHLPADLRFRGRPLASAPEQSQPGWSFHCYSYIQWDPHVDDLLRLLEMLRADLTAPSTL